jgi:hypothetical protein
MVILLYPTHMVNLYLLFVLLSLGKERDHHVRKDHKIEFQHAYI